MASFERFDDMGDLRLKPMILRNILSEHVPNEKQALVNFLSLSKVVSTIATHKLLSEFPLASSIDQKLQSKSKSAVDDWVERLLALISSDMPDKCWVGIVLMGVTCKECSSDRFFASYSVWFNSLLSHIKNPASSRIVRVASCTSISDLLTRLSRFSNTRKDAVSHAAKVILPIVKLLEEDSSEALWEGIVHLLSTIVILFPAAFHSSYDKVEAAIASKIFSAKTSSNILKKFTHFLALLPKANKGEGGWSLMMQKLLISINVHLNNFFQGLEEETIGQKAIQRLAPPGKDPPSPLGGQNGGLDDAAWNSEQLIISRVSALMFCSSMMLTSSYKSKVNIPVGSLLSLVERVLAVNGSLPRAMSPFMTGIQQELVCAELPTLHSSALELLRATIKSVRSQLLPYAASVVRLVSSYFKRCSLPVLRIKLYSITKTLLKSMGIGMTMQLAQEVVSNASVDLDLTSVEGFHALSTNTPSFTNGAVLKVCSKKRKHSANSGVETDNSAFEVGVPHNHWNSPISLKIAALEALETLLTIGGALGSDSWREHVDNLLMSTATNACEGRWAHAETYHCLPNESSTDLVEFQLAALRAFLASLVSPSRVRTAFLAEGLELFQTGKSQAEMEVAGFCAHALMSLEVVMHPRALPLDGLPSLSNQFLESNSLASQKHNTPNLIKLNGFARDGDDLSNRWLANVDVPSNNEIQRIVGTTLPVQETKRLKLGNDLATVVSLGVQDHTDIVGSQNVQQADVPKKVLNSTMESLGNVSDKDDMAPKEGYREVVSEAQEGEGLAAKDCIMEEAAIGKKRESLVESDDDSVPSLKADDYLSSDSDIES